MHLAVHMSIFSAVYSNEFWAFCLLLSLSVCALQRIKWHLLTHGGLFTEGLVIALTSYKILLCLILLALSFLSSHLSVGFCTSWVSISTLHSSFPWRQLLFLMSFHWGRLLEHCTGQVGEPRQEINNNKKQKPTDKTPAEMGFFAGP